MCSSNPLSSPAVELGFWRSLPRPFFALAPMEDVTDTVFRQLVARAGRPHVFFTEFTSTDGLFSRGRAGVIHRLAFTEEERPLVAQIWGNDPEKYFQAGGLLREMGFDGIDINMGCPVPKIIKNKTCSALIENKALAKELVLAAKEGAGDLPVSVKTRIVFRKKETEQWAEWLLQCDIAVLTMHGRTARQMSEVPADWSEIAKAVQVRNTLGKDTLIVGNGDVASCAEAAQKAEEYGVDGVMIGRGIFKDPFLFSHDGKSFRDLSQEEKLSLYAEHIRLFRETWAETRNISMVKKFSKIYIAGFQGASAVRERFVRAESYDEMLGVLQEKSTVEKHG